MQRLFVVLVLVLALVASAEVRFVSTPFTSATLNQRWRYDLDGLPSVESDGGAYSFFLDGGAPGMFLENLSGEVLWFPSVSGPVSFELGVRNAAGDVDVQRIVVNVGSGVAPDFVPPGAVTVNAGTPVSLQLRAASGDAPMTWQLEAGPMGALLQPELGTLTWQPLDAGTQRFTVSLTNAFGTNRHDFDVQVDDVPLPLPSAMLTVTPEQALPGTLVRLSGAGSSAGTPNASLSYLFDFGDGTPSRYGVEDSTQQGYVVPGVYLARVTVENVHLKRAEATARVVVRTDAGLSPPAAHIASDVQGGDVAPLAVQFTCDCTAGDSPLIGYQWEFGDGEVSDVRDPVHVFSAPGGYNVKLKVFDAVGLEARDSFYVPVWNSDGGQRPPFARARVRPTAVGDAPFAPELVAEFGDSDGIVVQRHWRLPDGRELYDEDPTLQLATLGAVRVELTVTDNDGLSSTDTLELKATRNGLLPPEIRSVAAVEARVGQPFLYDEDGRAAARNGPVRWSVGLVVDAQRVGAPEGLLVDEQSGALTWTPTAQQLGEQEVALVATNAAGSAVQRFKVAVAAAPVTGCGCSSLEGLSALTLLALLLSLSLSPNRGEGRGEG